MSLWKRLASFASPLRAPRSARFATPPIRLLSLCPLMLLASCATSMPVPTPPPQIPPLSKAITDPPPPFPLPPGVKQR